VATTRIVAISGDTKDQYPVFDSPFCPLRDKYTPSSDH
jgi:hypothetical protein